MPKLASQPVHLSCPTCGAPIHADVQNLVDVGLEPELKGRLLRGQVNVAHCDNCGSEGIIAAPLVYHDPDKELLLAFIPPETQMNDTAQQQLIGQLTNVVMSYLPPEKRKGYLLLPKVMLTYQRFVETILQADGITPEMIAGQRARLELLDRLLQALPDEETLRAIVAELDDRIDEDLLAILGASIQSHQQDGQFERAQDLEELRGRLLELSTHGRQVAARMLASEEHPPLSPEELLDKLLAAGSEEELAALVGWYRSGVDYGFYQMLTERMDAATAAGHVQEAQQLRELRETLLALTERLDAEAQEALERATQLLRELLDAPEPEQFIREHLGDFDDAFFIVLGANLQVAEQAGRQDVREALQKLGGMVLEIAQERLPPEVRLIRQLLNAPDDAAVTALLHEHEPLVNENLLLLMRDLANEVDDEAAAARLRQLVEPVEAWLRERAGPGK